jgi:hypothetical protein
VISCIGEEEIIDVRIAKAGRAVLNLSIKDDGDANCKGGQTEQSRLSHPRKKRAPVKIE